LATRHPTFSNDGDESATDHSGDADDLDDTTPPLVFVTARELRDAAHADACGATGCTRDDHLRPVTTPDGRTRALCRYHEKHVLGVTT
jgi:hypothetical protein